MRFKSIGACVVGVCVCVVATGCMPKMSMEDMKAMMPDRPAALDKLNMFMGHWDQEGTAKFSAMDEPIKMKARSTVKWEGDGWYLVETATYSMDGFDDMKGMAVWTYDAGHDRFRVTYFDTNG